MEELEEEEKDMVDLSQYQVMFQNLKQQQVIQQEG